MDEPILSGFCSMLWALLAEDEPDIIPFYEMVRDCIETVYTKGALTKEEFESRYEKYWRENIL